jgi:putative peptidoglycan lipid II flippase
VLGRIDFRLSFHIDLRDPRIRQILRLMLPVTIGLGVINFDLVINSSLGTLVSDQAPRAIDAAFRIYMLPQGMFSVAIATVLFPALSRLAARGDVLGVRTTMGAGLRQVALMLVPAAAFTLVLATPITRLVYQHGAFDEHSTELVSTALFWFSFSLPFSGMNLMLTRTFFSLQRPWVPTVLAVANMAVNAAVSVALYKPLGLKGLVIGTAVASVGMTLTQAWFLRPHLGGFVEGRRTAIGFGAMIVAAALLGVVAYVVWAVVDGLLGESLPAQILAVGLAIAAGTAAYAWAVLWLGMEEAHQVRDLLVRRFRRGAA